MELDGWLAETDGLLTERVDYVYVCQVCARHVDAVDTDPVAIEVTRQNASANGTQVSAHLPEVEPLGRYDVLVANILAQPLIGLAPRLAAVAKRGAVFSSATLRTALTMPR